MRTLLQPISALSKACLQILGAAVDHNILPVGLDIGGDGAGAHMSVEAEHTVSYIVVVRHFNLVEEDHVLEFC